MILDGQDCVSEEDIKSQPGKGCSTTRAGTLATEITVSAKTESSKVIEKGLHYGDLLISEQSDQIQSMIVDAIYKLGTHPDGEAPEIVVKTKTIWQS